MVADAPALTVDRRAERRRFVRFVIVVGSLIALPPLSVDLYLPALPALRDELGASAATTQLTLTGMLLGLGLGQLVVGPLSDAWGRRRPLLVGLAAHATASLLCMVAPSIEVLAVVRILQGLAAAAVSVVAMATIRDRFEGVAMARLMSRTVLVTGLAPIFAPTLGGQLLRFTDWRGIFGFLLAAALLLGLLALLFFDESLPAARRRRADGRAAAASYAELLRDRTFLALAMIGGLTAGSVFSYIASSSFVLQDGFGLSSQGFAVLFGFNALAFLVGAQSNPSMVRRFRIVDVMRVANAVGIGAAVLMVINAATGFGAVAGVAIPMAIVLASAGFVIPNTPALALHRHGSSAGAAAAVLGCLQFGTGALIAPVVGALGVDTALPLGAVMAALLGAACALLMLANRDAEVRAVGQPKT